MALPSLRPYVIVSSGGSRFKVLFANKNRREVVGVEQQIVPMRGSMYWRPINLTSKAAVAAAEVAERKLKRDHPSD